MFMLLNNMIFIQIYNDGLFGDLIDEKGFHGNIVGYVQCSI